MTASDESPNLHELLKHEAWLRGLARVLVGPSDADDLVQDTWMAAAKRPPEGEARPWLGAVARRLAAQTRRTRGRVARREAAAARDEALPSTEETLQALAVQREVTEAVDALPEPFRTAVLLRYHHELDYSEVASRTDCTEAAARQRVSRGLARLRSRLAERHGADWRAMPGFAALCRWPDSITTTAAPIAPGAAAVSKTTLLLGSLAMFKILAGTSGVALCVFLGWLAFADPKPDDVPVAADGETALVETDGGTPATVMSGVSRQVANPAGDQANAVGVDALSGSTTTQRIRGRVVDSEGRPVAEVPILRRRSAFRASSSAPDRYDPEQVAISGPDGAFTVELEGTWGELAGGAPWSPLTVSYLDTTRESDDALLVVAESVAVRGIVVAASEGGPEVPLSDVLIKTRTQKLVSLPFAMDRVERSRWPNARTDQDGEFDFGQLPAVGYRLVVGAFGYKRQEVEYTGGEPLRIVMQPTRRAEIVFTGTVRLPDGRAADAGSVGYAGRTTEIGADGRYRLELPRTTSKTGIYFAAAPGYQPAVVAEPMLEATPTGDGALLLDLTLPSAALTISGTVLDAQGEPMPGVVVYPWMTESLDRGQLLEDYSQPSGQERNRLTNVRTFAVTEANGSFTLRGLREQDYDLRFFDQKTYANRVRQSVAAGTQSLTVSFPVDALITELEGEVVNSSGERVVGAEVRHMVITWDDEQGRTSYSYASNTVTDERGRFVLQNVPTSDCLLVFQHPDHVRTQVEPQGGGVQRIELPSRCHVRIDVGASYPSAVSWRARDAQGDVLQLFKIESQARYSESTADLEGGRSEVRQVSERAASIELLDQTGGVVTRLPVRLVSGEVTTVR